MHYSLCSAGWEHHPSAAEDCQEDGARGGVEKDTSGPEGHGGSASAARRKGQCPAGRGEARSPLMPSDSLARGAAVPPGIRMRKPLSAYKCH